MTCIFEISNASGGGMPQPHPVPAWSNASGMGHMSNHPARARIPPPLPEAAPESHEERSNNWRVLANINYARRHSLYHGVDGYPQPFGCPLGAVVHSLVRAQPPHRDAVLLLREKVSAGWNGEGNGRFLLPVIIHRSEAPLSKAKNRSSVLYESL